MEQVLELVKSLYDPSSSPQAIQASQDQLLGLQKGAHGWELAEMLFGQNDTNCQFLGALTYSIKISDEKYAMPPNLRHTLLLHLQVALQRGYKPLVVHKLFSTIINLYLRTVSEWDSFMVDMHSVLSQHLALEIAFFEELVVAYNKDYVGVAATKAQLEKMIEPVLQLLRMGLDQFPMVALAAFSGWSMVFSSEFEPLLAPVVGLLSTPDEEVFEKTCQVLCDLYLAHSRAWPKPDKSALIQTILRRSQPFDADLSGSLGRLALAVCGQDLLKGIGADSLLPYIQQLTVGDNAAIHDDPMASEVLEFWNTVAEDIIAEGMSTDYNGIFMDVVQRYWKRIQLGDLSAAEWEELHSFRRDFSDFLELVYPLLGRQLFETFAQNILMSVASRPNYNWIELEASLCCLNALAEFVKEDSEEATAIEAVFGSQLWTDLGQCPVLRVRHTAINVIGSYDSFFVQPAGRQNMAVVLTYLFESLSQHSLQLISSRSIQKLCSACRHSLGPECFNFLKVYEPLRFKLLPEAHQRTVSAIAYVVQALDLEQQVEPLWRLLVLTETSEQEPIYLVKCISGIGKALQLPSDSFDLATKERATAFWDSDPHGIRENILQVVNQAFNMSPDVFEELCHVFKAGLSEQVPTAFSLGANTTLDFLQAKKQQHSIADMPAILDLASFLISTRAAGNELTPSIVSRAVDLVSVDAVAPSLQLLSMGLSKAPAVFLALPNAADYIGLALSSLDSTDRFVLKQASDFWVVVLKEPLCKELVANLGLDLVNKVARQICGEAERSEVVYFSDILRKLIENHMRLSGQFLKKAFLTDPQPRNLKRQDDKTRSAFVSQLQLLRGGTQTRQVVSKFWLVCRGLPEY